MLDPDLLWHWQRTNDPLSALRLVLPFMMGATLGATLASLVTWIEGQLATGENWKSANVHSLPTASPANSVAPSDRTAIHRRRLGLNRHQPEVGWTTRFARRMPMTFRPEVHMW